MQDDRWLTEFPGLRASGVSLAPTWNSPGYTNSEVEYQTDSIHLDLMIHNYSGLWASYILTIKHPKSFEIWIGELFRGSHINGLQSLAVNGWDIFVTSGFRSSWTLSPPHLHIFKLMKGWDPWSTCPSQIMVSMGSSLWAFGISRTTRLYASISTNCPTHEEAKG